MKFHIASPVTRSVAPIDRWLPPFALALLPFLLFWPLIIGGRALYVHDLQNYFYPYHMLSATLLRDGTLPLWNPYAFSGLPLLGDGQSAMLYPPNWFFFLSPSTLALNIAVLLQFSIAGVSMYLLARHLGLLLAPAFLAALAFMFCGFLTARIVHLSIMSGAALLPLVIWRTDLAFSCRTLRNWLLAAVVVGLQLLPGHPQIPVYTAVGVGLLAVIRGLQSCPVTQQWRPVAQNLLLTLGFYLFGYLLIAIQLIPWFELIAASPRAAGASFEFVMGSGTHGSDWLLLLFPYLYGQIAPGVFGDQAMGIEAAVRAWEHSAYLGILPLALSLVGMAAFVSATRARQRDARWFTLLWLLLLLLVGIIIGAGKFTPLAGLVYLLPVIGKLRDVERAFVLVSFALALLAAFGLQWLMTRSPREVGRLRRIAPLLAALLILLLPLLAIGIARFSGIEELQHLTQSRTSAWLPVVWAAASALLLFNWMRFPPGAISLGLAGLLLLADMGSYAVNYQPSIDIAQFQRRPDVLQALDGNGQPFRKTTFLSERNDLPTHAAQETLAVSWSMVFGIEDINGFNSLQPRRYTDYLFGSAVEDVSYGYLRDQQLLQPESPILNSLNVRYLLIPVASRRPLLGPQFRRIYENSEVRLYENTAVWPRAFFANRARSETDPQAVLQTVTADGFDARQESLVEQALPSGLANTTGTTSAQVRQQSPNRLVIEATTDAPRLLVTSEMFFPGWQATIDGVATPIYQTNYLFRGVVVPAGSHTVMFSYRPLSALLGSLISGIALLFAVGLWIWDARRVRRKQSKGQRRLQSDTQP